MKKVTSLVALLTLSLMVLFTACNKNNDMKSLDDEFKNQEADLEFSEYGDFQKVITKPLIKRDDCDFIVSGIIEFYKDDQWIATIDFGDGVCDEWATKTWDGGSKVFSLRKDKD